MQTDKTAKPPLTEITDGDRQVLRRLLSRLGPHAKLEPVQTGHRLSSEAVWQHIVAQVCVMGSARGMGLLDRTGLSHDVIALDVRVVGALRRYCGYNLTAAQVQARRDVYLSVEDALRQVCREARAPLALLDRVLFQFSGMSAVEFALTCPGPGRGRW